MAALYSVIPVDLPNRFPLDLGPTIDVRIMDYPNSLPPRNVAMSRNGAVIEASGDFVVRRSGGHLVRVPFPSREDLAKFLPLDELVTMRNVVLADDGTPFATFEIGVGGAMIATERIVLSWNGSRWKSACDPKVIDGENVAIGAARSLDRYTCNGDYLNSFPEGDDSKPHFMENQAEAGGTAGFRSLGFGATTAMCGRFIVGYSDGAHIFYSSDPEATTALEWNGTLRTILGRGVAYAVNGSGDAVGDDQANVKSDGHPMLWTRGRAIRLSAANGVAYGIGDDGTIVGRIGNDGFFISGSDSHRRVVRFDNAIASRSWHVREGLAIDAEGVVLAIATQGMYERTVLLAPR